MENWIDIIEFEGYYQVSNKSRIRSVDRYVTHNYGGNALKKGKILKQRIDKDGYLKVTLKRKQIGKVFFVHRLVAIYFIDNPENKPQVNHKNGIKSDNSLNNLEWVTPFENRQHAYNTGLQKARRGEINNWCKLKLEDVLYIKKNYKKRIITNKILAEKFNVTQGCIQAITSGKNWNHI